MGAGYGFERQSSKRDTQDVSICAADPVLTNGFSVQVQNLRPFPDRVAVCTRHVSADGALRLVQVEVYRRPAPQQQMVRVSLPFLAEDDAALGCHDAVRQVLDEQRGGLGP